MEKPGNVVIPSTSMIQPIVPLGKIQTTGGSISGAGTSPPCVLIPITSTEPLLLATGEKFL